MGKTRDFFKKIRDNKGTFHAKIGSIKDRNGMDLTEAEDFKKRWQEYTEELYKKDLHNHVDQGGVITHLVPDILECEVKWALGGSITTNKASGGDGIPVELFPILKMMLWKCFTQYASTFAKLSSDHRTGNSQFSFQSQREEMPKNAQTSAQLHSSHILVNECSKLSKSGFSNTWTENFQMFKLVLEKAEEPEIKLPISAGSLKKQESSRKTSISALLVCQSLWLCGSQ